MPQIPTYRYLNGINGLIKDNQSLEAMRYRTYSRLDVVGRNAIAKYTVNFGANTPKLF